MNAVNAWNLENKCGGTFTKEGGKLTTEQATWIWWKRITYFKKWICMKNSIFKIFSDANEFTPH